MVTKKFLFILIVLLTGFAATSQAEVVILTTDDVKPYEAALSGAQTACKRTTIIHLSSAAQSEISKHQPSAILAIGSEAFTEALQVPGIPVTFAMVPPKLSLERLSASGVVMAAPVSSYIQAIKNSFPTVKKIGIMYGPTSFVAFRQLAATATVAGIAIKAYSLVDHKRLPALLQQIRKETDMLLLLPDVDLLNLTELESIFDFALRQKCPVFGFAEKHTMYGAVGALQMDPYDMGMQAGEDVCGPPAIKQRYIYARRTTIIINRKLAARFGLPVSAGGNTQETDVK